MFATLYSIIQVYSCCASFYYIGCFFIIRQSNTGPWLHSNQNCSSWTRPTRPSLCHATLRSYRCVTERPISTHTKSSMPCVYLPLLILRKEKSLPLTFSRKSPRFIFLYLFTQFYKFNSTKGFQILGESGRARLIARGFKRDIHATGSLEQMQEQ